MPQGMGGGDGEVAVGDHGHSDVAVSSAEARYSSIQPFSTATVHHGFGRGQCDE
ncbi:hypothetical protein ACFFOP_29340 [Sinosporangium siamense]|uniref:hypothetical protein n=1 Tax=Sinosporangium siamense TaxID=1367973 RepID=UPI0035EE47E6